MQRHKGFSLLEILVAFAIMAVALTIVLRIFGSGVNNAVVSEEYSLAVQIAESLMARTGVETPLQIGEATGTEADKYDWLVAIRPVARTSATDSGQLQNAETLQLLSVKIKVTWGEEEGRQRSIELNNLKTQRVQG